MDAAAKGQRKRRAALFSLAASAALSALKLIAGLFSGSLALLSEGAHNAVDIAASGLTYLAVREADRPPDDEHPFGHAKLEAVAALIETGALIALALGVVGAALLRVGHGAHVEVTPLAVGAVLVSLGVDLWRWRGLARVAKETGSEALAADALHFSSDLVSSACVLLGLIAARLGYVEGDALAAFAVALFIAVAGYRLGRRTVDSLIDTAPEGMADSMRRAVAASPGVAGVDFLRLRRNGAQVLGDLGIGVARTLPLERVASIKDDLAARLKREWPEAALTITANGRALNDETLRERVMAVAALRRLAVHHILVRRLAERISIALDLEVDGRMRIADAHAIASQLEAAIIAEIGPEVDVDTHIEPIDTREADGEEAAPALAEAVARSLAEHAQRLGVLSDVHDVRVTMGASGAVAIFHCEIAGGASVREAHDAVDALERAVRADFPNLVRVTGHVEPR